MEQLCKLYIYCSDPCLKIWNFNSTLKNTIASILGKLEGSGNSGNYGNIGHINQIQMGNNMKAQNVIVDKKDNKEDEISNELVKDLNSKSLEELIFIYYNEEDYVYEFTNKTREANLKMIQEIDILSGIHVLK